MQDCLPLRPQISGEFFYHFKTKQTQPTQLTAKSLFVFAMTNYLVWHNSGKWKMCPGTPRAVIAGNKPETETFVDTKH